MSAYEYRKLSGIDIGYIHEPKCGHLTTLEQCAAELNRLAAERDAAIRERDEARMERGQAKVALYHAKDSLAILRNEAMMERNLSDSPSDRHDLLVRAQAISDALAAAGLDAEGGGD